MTLQDELVSIERSLWGNDPGIYAARFLPDSILVFGETGRLSLAIALEGIREENQAGRWWESVEFADVHVAEPVSGAALLTYLAEARWNDSGEAQHLFCSTLYVRQPEGWRVAFHQQTPDLRGKV